MNERNCMGVLVAMVIMCVAGCTSAPKERYLLSFYSVSGDTVDETFRAEVARHQRAIARHGGRLAVAPIENQGPIVSEAAPDYVSEIPGDFLVVSTFASQEQLVHFLSRPSDERRSTDPNIHIDATVAAKLFKPMPMMADYPVIGSIAHAAAPAFILLNGISMNSMANPMTGIRMMRYMNANFPRLEAQGTVLLGTFEATEVVDGAFDFDMLFLTEWQSDEAYNSVHQDPAFIDIAKKTRNRAFNRFADDRGVIRSDLR